MASKTTDRFLRKLEQSAGKAGVYYVVKFPSRWRLYSFPWDDFGDLWLGDAWRRYLAQDLAEAWELSTGIPAAELKKQLLPPAKGFPRGHVERAASGEYTVFHADDLETFMGIDKKNIARTFELTNQQVIWSLDEHERCDAAQKAVLRRLLAIAEDWKAGQVNGTHTA